MKHTQLELPLPPPWIQRYQILDSQSDYEEANINPIKGSACLSKRNSPIAFPASVETNNHYSHPSGNPYSRVNDDEGIITPVPTFIPITQVSSKIFKHEASRILRQYSPTVGKLRRLRPEFRTFVNTQTSKTPAHRAKILAELKKYDLSTSGYAEPLFNRELSDQVLKKLSKIGNQ